MEDTDLIRRFAYHPPRDEQTKRTHERVREAMHEAAAEINLLVPEGREKALAVTKLEEAMMWANAGIARAPSAGG